MTDETTTANRDDEDREPTMTPAEMREHLESAVKPLDGAPIFKRDWPAEGLEEGGGYEQSARALGRALLETAEADPSLLDVSKENAEDPSGWAAASNDKLWEAALERYPGLDDWLGGVTGFQYGWAHNSVRYALGADQTGNPAIVTVRPKDDAQ